MKGKWPVIAGLLLTLGAAFFVYYPSIFYDFSNWDDPRLIINNPRIRSLSWDNIKLLFNSFYWLNYYPLNLLSYAIEYHFFGLNPHVIHFNNLILHLCNVFLVFIFISRLSHNRITAFVASSLFALHPMCVETVVWASERKDVLYTSFYLIALILYLQYSRYRIALEEGRVPFSSPSQRFWNNLKYFMLPFIFFVLSCFSKGMAVSFSMVIICIDFLLKRKFSIYALSDKIPFFLVSLIYGITVSRAVVGDKLDYVHEIHNWPEKIQFASYGFLFYLSHFLLPLKQSVFYPYIYPTGTLPLYYILYPFAVLILSLGVAATLFYSRKILFGYAFFTCALLLVLQLKQTNAAIVADRYSYVAYIGLFYIIGEFFGYLFSSINRLYLKTIVFALLLSSLSVYGYLAHKRVKVWRNNVTLWGDASVKYPCPLSYNNLANALQKLRKYQMAVNIYSMALDKSPNNYLALNNLASLLIETGRPEEAISKLLLTLRTKPYYPDACSNLAVAFYNLGQYDSALHYVNRAISMDPNNYFSYHTRGSIYASKKLFDLSILDYLSAIRLSVNNFEDLKNLGNVYADQKFYSKALEAYNSYLQIDSTDLKTIFNRGLVLLFMGDTAGACHSWQKALVRGFVPAILKVRRYCPELKNIRLPDYFSVPKVLYFNGKVKLDVADVFENDSVVTKLRHYDEKGIKTEEGIIDSSGRYSGEILWFYPGGSVKISGYYKDTIPYGLWKEFYEDGALKASYLYENGCYNGSYPYYHRNGRLWTERIYRNGKLWNVLSNRDSSGNSLDPGTLKNGNGSLNIYDEGGKLRGVINYINGVKSGT